MLRVGVLSLTVEVKALVPDKRLIGLRLLAKISIDAHGLLVEILLMEILLVEMLRGGRLVAVALVH